MSQPACAFRRVRASIVAPVIVSASFVLYGCGDDSSSGSTAADGATDDVTLGPVDDGANASPVDRGASPADAGDATVADGASSLDAADAAPSDTGADGGDASTSPGDATTGDAGEGGSSDGGTTPPDAGDGAALDGAPFDATVAGGDATVGADASNGDAGGDGSAASAADVLQHHDHATRDGVYVDSALTKAAMATMHLDATFAATVTGNVYAQPLYVEEGPGGREAFVVATEQNHVSAIDGTGASVWDKTFGAAATRAALPCGNIDPLGITGTPIVDLPSRTIYFDAMAIPAGGTAKHFVYGVSLDDGSTRTGWPVDVSAAVTGFDSPHQNERGALSLLNGVLYVPYGGHYGDCNPYHGWVVAIPIANPSQVTAWSTGSIGSSSASRGGIWAAGGLASDGTSFFASTGNTLNAGSTWSGGEAVLRLGRGPTFSNQSANYYYPANWMTMDTGDVDLGGANPVVFDMPGAPVPRLVVALGKDGNLYLLNRDNLGGAAGALSVTLVANGEINGAPAVYSTALGTYVAFHVAGNTPRGCPAGAAGNVGVAKITPGATPTAAVVWCTAETGLGSPMVTTTGSGDVIVWDANNRLYGYDGDTGAKVFAGGVAADVMASTMQYFNTPIAAKGRVAAAVSGHLYVFRP